MTKNEKIVEHIKKCYEIFDFNPKEFSFLKSRKTKAKHRVGIYTDSNGEKYFFKIVKSDEYNNEKVITEKIESYFTIVPKLYEKEYGSMYINLYPYVDTNTVDAYNYLRKKDISLKEKKAKLSTFMNRYIELQRKYLFKDKMNGNRLSDMWFHKRIYQDDKAGEYYGKNFEKLLEFITVEVSDLYEYYKIFFDNIYKYLNEKKEIIVSFTHGDFHDFNFSLDGYFWDIDTFGYNPIMNDLVIYYWHFHKREDNLILKYSPWLTSRMFNQLDNNELQEIRNLKKEEIIKWYDFVKETYKENNIDKNLNEEFIFKLFCRVFLVDNILDYEKEDKIMVIKSFSKFLKHKEEDLKSIMFLD